MTEAVHFCLFVLLPLALTLRVALGRRMDALRFTDGALHFCLGVGKLLLLVIPLVEMVSLVLRAGAVNTGLSSAWLCMLCMVLALRLLMTSLKDIADALRAWWTLAEGTALPLPVWPRARTYSALALILVTVIFVFSPSFTDGWLFFKTLIWPSKRTLGVSLQDARVWTDFHIITTAAAAAVSFLAPHTSDFLRIWRPWKGWWCLAVFVLATALLWTRVSPVS